MVLSKSPAWAKDKAVFQQNVGGVINTTRWWLPAVYGQDQSITVRVIQEPHWKYHLEFTYKNSIQVVKAVPPYVDAFGLRIRDVFALDDQNLATLWKTATGNLWDLKVYTFSNGKVTEALHGTSIYRPEFVCLDGTGFMSQPLIVAAIEAGHPNVVIDTKRLVQGIVISQAKKSNGKWVPSCSDVFLWDSGNKRYIKHSDVPWKNRLIWN